MDADVRPVVLRAVSTIDGAAATPHAVPAAPPPRVRLHQLDGLRGAAALVVVGFHFLCAFAPRFAPYPGTPLSVSDGTILGAVFNGAFAVAVFFVLSGFVVSNAAAARRDPVYVLATLRYLRLALPATASVCLAWLLLSELPEAAQALHRLAPSPWLQWTYQGDIPSGGAALYDGMVGIFLTGGSQFNNVLWTMRIELLGSFLLYAIYAWTQGRARIALLLAAGIAAAALHRYAYDGFILGALLREAWSRNRLAVFAPFALFCLGLALGSHAALRVVASAWLGHPDAGIVPAGAVLPASGFLPVMSRPTAEALDPLAAALVVYGCLCSARLTALLSWPVFQYLGRVSFALYLVHVPILYTLVAAAVVVAGPLDTPGLGLAFALFLALSLAVAWVFCRLVDEPVLDLLTALRRVGAAPRPVSACDRQGAR